MPEHSNPIALHRVASMVYNTPLMISEAKLQTIMSFLGPRLHGGEMLSAAEMRMHGDRMEVEPVATQDASVRVISVDGVMMHKARGMDALSGMTTYESISTMIRDAVGDPDVSAVVLDLSTPGGMVSGAFDLADSIREMTGTKPIYAIVNEEANSAGYLLASAAEKVYITQTAMVGSIGVIMQHVDVSELNAKLGIKYTSIFSGEHKADFSPNAPLPKDVKAAAQEEVDELRVKFATTVANNRGLTVAQVLATEAAVYAGEAAVTVGLADVVLSVDQAFDDIFQLIANRSATNMPATNNPVQTTAVAGNIPVAAAVAPIPTPAPVEPTVTVATANAQTKDAVASATTAERERISSIFALDEAKGRDTMCKTCVEMGLSVDDAKKLLAAAPGSKPVAAATPSDPLASVMQGEPNPDISANGDAGEGPESELNTLVSSMLSNYGTINA